MGLNHAQRLALNLDAHLVLDAGAGTGKTKTIVDRVIEHYLTPVQRASMILPRPSRPGRLAGGMIVDGNAHRVDLNEWGGLLPTEVIVLTFTNAAAEELKHRIRIALGELREGTTSGDDNDGADSRITAQGLPDQFRMLLEDAPIGTIDSFFTRLVAPHRALLGIDVTDEQVSDSQRVSLEMLAVNTAWRLPSNPSRLGDASDAGVPSEILDRFFLARRRVSQTVGSTTTCRKILSGMLSRSVFLEGAAEELYDSSIDEISPEKIRTEVTNWLDQDRIFQVLENLQSPLVDWFETISDAGAMEDTDSGTRLAALDHILSLPPPSDSWSALLRIFHLYRIISAQTGSRADGGNGLTKKTPPIFPRGYLPTDSPEWDRGHTAYANIKENLDQISTTAKEIWSNPTHLFERKMAFIVGMLDETIPTHMPLNYPIRPQMIEIPTSYSGSEITDGRRFNLSQEAIMLNDLWIVHQATLGILRQLKSTRGLHDFEDISELAGDLLLSRCPDICRKFYSGPIIDSLNDIDFLRPWSDDHLNRTLSLAHEALEDPTSLGYATHSEAEKALMDLLGRIDLLKRIRRRYLAMILDEAQDINPRQWRLLSRLWGPRHREDNDSVPEQNLEWEPTICYVGDIKQSIYLFRQAQVSTFHRFASHLRRINDQELTTLDIFKEPNPLRTNEWSRDPRALHDTFVRASMHTSDYRRSLNPEVRFDGSDNVHQVSTDEIALRSSGHVRLSINYRTSGGLLRVMDRWWKDVFHHRHRTFSDADWYATEQELKPCSEKAENPGILEWLLPIGPKGENVVPVDPIQPIDPFIHGDGDRKKLESTLIVERIRALIDGSDCTIRTASGEQHYFEEEAPVNPSDIMVLLPSRKYRDSILSGLKGLGIPVQADKEGPLFSRPSVRPLLALVQLCARPHHRHHAAWVARSVLVGLEDDELDRYIRGSNSGTNLIQRLASFAHTKQQAALIQGWERRANSGRIVELLNWTLDHSDLLLSHPMASDRIDAEKFVEFIRFTLQESGGDPVLLADRLARIERDGDGDFAKDMSPSGGVRVMTIHKSKGLQSKVVILADIFGHSQTKLIHENQARLIVTPQMFGVHPKPWLNQSDPISSVWNYIKILHESQVQAEARRLLYVAATRAEERLIISGSPSGAYFGDSGIELEVEQGTTPCFGSMLLESMRQSSCSNKEKSPWLIGDEILGTELIDTPRKYELTIDPIKVAMNCGLGIDDGIGIRIYHSPECFEERTTAKTVFRSLIDLSETLSDIEKNPPSSPSVNPRQIVMRSNITPSSIDVAQTCMRQYWLKSKIGLKEDINLLDIDSKTEPDTLPPPNVIGTIVHRLVEIGVPSPKRSFDTHPLPIEWTNDTGSSWKDSALEASMGEVFEEYLPSGIDLDQTRKLVSSMISILDTSIFGQFLNEGVGEMGKLDGVRTEMPFGMELEVEGPPFELFTDTPRGKHIHSISEKKIARFSGLIDLVVAFQNSENESSLLPVDLKTEDARILLGSMEKVEGTLLEPVSDEEISEAEKEILMKHRHQLFIYYYALECQEANRASNGMPRRIVEFPAIWVGVSGRLVQMSNEIMSLAESELHPLLSEMIAIDYGVKCDSNSFLCSEAGHHKCHF